MARERIFNVPGAVLTVLAALVGVHLLRAVLSPQDDLWLVYLLAFVPARYAGYASEFPGGTTTAFTSFLSHAFVHGNLLHLGFNAAWLLAFGGAIAKRIGSLRFIAFFSYTAIMGAAFFLMLNWGLAVPVVGASGAISGLMGAVFRYLFSALESGGISQLQDETAHTPLMPLASALRDRRIVFAIAIWLGLNALAAIGIGTSDVSGSIAWEAHIGGFIAGFMTFSLFDVHLRNSTREKPTQY